MPKDPLEAARALARALDHARLVIYDEELEIVAEWNGSATFNTYALDGSPLDCFTRYGLTSPNEARSQIEAYFDEMRKEDQDA